MAKVAADGREALVLFAAGRIVAFTGAGVITGDVVLSGTEVLS
jgi:hypothetical protein